MSGSEGALPGARPPRAGGSLADVALMGLVAVPLIAGVLRLGVSLACLMAGQPDPDSGLGPALRALATPADPASAWPRPEQIPGAVLYWAGTGVVVSVAALVLVAVWWVARRLIGGRSGRDDPRRRLGMASASEAVASAGSRAVASRADVVRPSVTGLGRVAPQEVGYRVGRASGRDLWCSIEDSVLVVGPPRMGKGLHLMIPWVLDAPGPVVATSTRPDTLAVTHTTRAERGPVAIFDPQQLSGLPGGLRWSPVRFRCAPRASISS